MISIAVGEPTGPTRHCPRGVKTSVAPFQVTVTVITEPVPLPVLERRMKLPTADVPHVNVVVVPEALKSAALREPDSTVTAGTGPWEEVELDDVTDEGDVEVPCCPEVPRVWR